MQADQMQDAYLRSILGEIPRLIGMLDRNILSDTYGCFDRQYWHYNTTDFACARNQEALLTLALLYKINHKKNPYFKKKNILDWACAAMEFWSKIQSKNGSFNEWYPNENSFVATAFSTYAVSEAVLILKNEVDIGKSIIMSLEKACEWMLLKHETTAQNQESGAIAALYNVFLLIGKRKYKSSAEEKVLLMEKRQDKEGWFSEYGGPDIGYLSLAIDYLSKYYSKSKDKKARKIIENSISFIKYFLHPDYSAGGEYGSRNTEYLIPHGFELFSSENKDAQIISNHIIKSILNNGSIVPACLDERYLLYNGYTYLQAHIDFSKKKINDALYNTTFTKTFENCGIFISSTNDFYFITNMKKGGAFRVYNKENKKVFSDSGISVITEEQKLTSAWLDNSSEFNLKNGKIFIEGNFFYFQSKNLSPQKNIALRVFQTTVGKSQNVGLFMKKILRGKLITDAKRSNLKFKRTIEFKEKSIFITDAFQIAGNKKIILNGKESYIYVPSSRYFKQSDIDFEPVVINSKDEKIQIKRVFNKNGMRVAQ